MTLSKILFFSDVHFKEHFSVPSLNVLRGGLPAGLQNIMAGVHFVASEVHDRIKKDGLDAVIFGGDWFHYPDHVSTIVLSVSCDLIRVLTDLCDDHGIPIYFLAGNHDQLNQKHHLLKVTDRCITEPTKVTIGSKTIGLVPHIPKLENYILETDKLKKKCDLMVIHQDVNGCQYCSGQQSVSKFPNKYGIPVISGDIHTYGTYGDVTYIGSLVQDTFSHSDLSSVGGVMVYDLGTGEIERIPNTWSKHFVKITDLSQASQFKKDSVIIKAIVDADTEETSKALSGFDYIHVKPIKNVDTETATYSDFNMVDSTKFLRNYIKDNNPNAISVFNEVMGG